VSPDVPARAVSVTGTSSADAADLPATGERSRVGSMHSLPAEAEQALGIQTALNIFLRLGAIALEFKSELRLELSLCPRV
jgi:hypothetical protein